MSVRASRRGSANSLNDIRRRRRCNFHFSLLHLLRSSSFLIYFVLLLSDAYRRAVAVSPSIPGFYTSNSLIRSEPSNSALAPSTSLHPPTRCCSTSLCKLEVIRADLPDRGILVAQIALERRGRFISATSRCQPWKPLIFPLRNLRHRCPSDFVTFGGFFLVLSSISALLLFSPRGWRWSSFSIVVGMSRQQCESPSSPQRPDLADENDADIHANLALSDL